MRNPFRKLLWALCATIGSGTLVFFLAHLDPASGRVAPWRISVDPFELQFKVADSGTYEISRIDLTLECKRTPIRFEEPGPGHVSKSVPLDIETQKIQTGTAVTVRLRERQELTNPFRGLPNRQECYSVFSVTLRDPRFSPDHADHHPPLHTTFVHLTDVDSGHAEAIVSRLSGMELRPAYSRRDGYLREGSCHEMRSGPRKCFYYLFANAFDRDARLFQRGWYSDPLFLEDKEAERIKPLQDHDLSDHGNHPLTPGYVPP